MVMPGDNVNLADRADYARSPWRLGLRFAIREGGHTVGAGTVTEILG